MPPVQPLLRSFRAVPFELDVRNATIALDSSREILVCGWCGLVGGGFAFWASMGPAFATFSVVHAVRAAACAVCFVVSMWILFVRRRGVLAVGEDGICQVKWTSFVGIGFLSLPVCRWVSRVRSVGIWPVHVASSIRELDVWSCVLETENESVLLGVYEDAVEAWRFAAEFSERWDLEVVEHEEVIQLRALIRRKGEGSMAM